MLMELKTGAAPPNRMLLTVFVRVGLAGNSRSSTEAGLPVGAVPPAQLPLVFQLASTLPVQLKVAGVTRVSSCSRFRRLRLRVFLLLPNTSVLSRRSHVADP